MTKIALTSRPRRVLTSAILAGITLFSLAASAEPRDEGPRAADARTSGRFAADGWMGMGVQLEEGDHETTANLGTTLLYRPGPLTLGAGLELGGEFLGNDQYRLGALGGTTFAVTDWFAIDALAEVGAHVEVMSTSWEMFDDTRVVAGDRTVTLPYAGVRLSPTLQIGRVGRPRFIIGPWLLARSDLGRTTANFTEESCGTAWFTDEYSCSTSEESQSVGGLEFTGGIRAGMEWGKP